MRARRSAFRERPDLVVRPRPLDRRQGLIALGGQVIPCALGKGGMRSNKREGDGATPRGRLAVLGGHIRGAPAFAGPTRIALRPIGADLGWCDAPADRNYNRPVRWPYPASAERLRRDDELYDIVIILDWNIRPRRRQRGSAIFLHLARPGFAPTEGCIAVTRRDMTRLLALLTVGRAFVVRT